MTLEKISKVYKIFIRRAFFTLTLRDNVAIIVVGQSVHLMKTFFNEINYVNCTEKNSPGRFTSHQI